MKKMLYILLFPLIIYAQNTTTKPILNSKYLFFSTDLGVKLYSGNLFLEQQNFSREGVFLNFSILHKKKITQSTHLSTKSSLIFSNAIAKKIQVISSFEKPDTDIYFTTSVPNILSCNINFSIELCKKINSFLSHSAIIKYRLYSLFYKKGNLFGGEINSIGGFISSEENGSLPGLEKPTSLSYSINYSFNKKSIIRLLFFLNSDWSLNYPDQFKTYPGIAIHFEKLIKLNK